MERSGVIEPSNSEWAAPVVVVTEKDGSLRFCVDYRKFNALSRPDAYPMPRVDELIDKLSSATYITTLDLMRGYWQVPVTEESRTLTAFATPFLGRRLARQKAICGPAHNINQLSRDVTTANFPVYPGNLLTSSRLPFLHRWEESGVQDYDTTMLDALYVSQNS